MIKDCNDCKFALKSKIGVYGCDLFNGKQAHPTKKYGMIICVKTRKKAAPLLSEMFNDLK